MKNFILKVLGLYLAWRVVLFIVTIFGILLLSAPGNADLSNGLLVSYKNVWNFWDGGFYHDIAKTGYHEPENSAFGGFPVRTAFFPMYPFLVRTLTYITSLDFDVTQLVVSFFAMGVALVFLGLLIKKIADERTALYTLIALLVFPFSYFFAAGYSESIFLMFVAGFFYFVMAKNNLLIASLFAAGASATRPVGLVLAVILVLHYLLDKSRKRTLKDLIPFAISVLGPIVYMIYLKLNFGDAFIFLEAQKGWRGGIGGNFVLNLWQDLGRLVPIEKTIGWSLLFFERFALLFAVALGAYLIIRYKKQYLLLSAYLLLSILLPVLTGTFGSLNRLVIVIFPIFFALALLLRKKPILFISYVLISYSLMVIWAIYYTHSIWTG